MGKRILFLTLIFLMFMSSIAGQKVFAPKLVNTVTAFQRLQNTAQKRLLSVQALITSYGTLPYFSLTQGIGKTPTKEKKPYQYVNQFEGLRQAGRERIRAVAALIQYNNIRIPLGKIVGKKDNIYAKEDLTPQVLLEKKGPKKVRRKTKRKEKRNKRLKAKFQKKQKKALSPRSDYSYNKVDEFSETQKSLDRAIYSFLQSESFSELVVQQLLQLINSEIELVDLLLAKKVGQDIDDVIQIRNEQLRNAIPSIAYIYDKLMDLATYDQTLNEQFNNNQPLILEGNNKSIFLRSIKDTLQRYYTILRSMQYEKSFLSPYV